jgi:hypothetical protein
VNDSAMQNAINYGYQSHVKSVYALRCYLIQQGKDDMDTVLPELLIAWLKNIKM